MTEVRTIHYMCVGCGTEVTLTCSTGTVEHNVHGSIVAKIEYRAIHRCNA